jgi:hypothetical protein
VQFVIRLNMGANPPLFYYDAEQKQRLQLLVAPINKPQIYRQVYYMGRSLFERDRHLALWFQRTDVDYDQSWNRKLVWRSTSNA